MKNSFILYHDIVHIFDKLTNEQSGILIKAILDYEVRGKIPTLDFALDLAITPILQSLDRNKAKHAEVSRRRALAGSRGGKQKVANLANASNCYESDSDSDSDSDSELKKDFSKEKSYVEQKLDGAQPVKKKNPNKEIKKQALEVLDFLNKVTGRNFRPVDANLKLIEARLRSGVKVHQCRAIIGIQYNEWKDSEKMFQYLRPATLFNKTKFEQYFAKLNPNYVPPEEENEDEKDV